MTNNRESTVDIIEKISTFSSEKLCEIIVCNRYFGSFKDLAIVCMEELSNRRENGSDFAFETYIDNSLKEFPKQDSFTPNIGNLLSQIVIRK